MWRIRALVAVLVVAAIVGAALYWTIGRGGDGASSRERVAACFNDRTKAAADSATINAPGKDYTVEEARKTFDWFRFPMELPPSARVGEIWSHHLLCQPAVLTVEARIDGPGFWFLLDESNFGTSGDTGTPVEVDGSPGIAFNNGAVWITTWKRNGNLYSVAAKYGGELTQEWLLRSLNTML